MKVIRTTWIIWIYIAIMATIAAAVSVMHAYDVLPLH